MNSGNKRQVNTTPIAIRKDINSILKSIVTRPLASKIIWDLFLGLFFFFWSSFRFMTKPGGTETSHIFLASTHA